MATQKLLRQAESVNFTHIVYIVIGAIFGVALLITGVYLWQKLWIQTERAQRAQQVNIPVGQSQNQPAGQLTPSVTSSESNVYAFCNYKPLPTSFLNANHTWRVYTNAKYNYTLRVPDEIKHCIVEGREGPDCDFEIKENFSNDYDLFQIDTPELTYLDVRASDNNLEMSGVEFGRRSLSMNRQYDRGGYYIGERDLSFAGVAAFEITADKGFEERGRSYPAESVSVDDPRFYEKANEGTLLCVPHKILYFGKDDVIYRIMYPAQDPVAEKIISSFRFIN